MSKINSLMLAPPYPVEQALKRLGANLRTARLRRNLTIQDVAKRIGTGPRPVSDAERGKASTGAAVYVALLWVYDLIEPLSALADPATDVSGLALSAQRERARTPASRELDRDF